MKVDTSKTTVRGYVRDKRKYLFKTNVDMPAPPDDGFAVHLGLISVNTREKVKESTNTPRKKNETLLLALHVPPLEMSTKVGHVVPGESAPLPEGIKWDKGGQHNSPQSFYLQCVGKGVVNLLRGRRN